MVSNSIKGSVDSVNRTASQEKTTPSSGQTRLEVRDPASSVRTLEGALDAGGGVEWGTIRGCLSLGGALSGLAMFFLCSEPYEGIGVILFAASFLFFNFCRGGGDQNGENGAGKLKRVEGFENIPQRMKEEIV